MNEIKVDEVETTIGFLSETRCKTVGDLPAEVFEAFETRGGLVDVAIVDPARARRTEEAAGV